MEARHQFGLAFGDVERIFCQALRRATPEFMDYSMMTCRMKSGIIAKVVGTWAHPGGFRRGSMPRCDSE